MECISITLAIISLVISALTFLYTILKKPSIKIVKKNAHEIFVINCGEIPACMLQVKTDESILENDGNTYSILTKTKLFPNDIWKIPIKQTTNKKKLNFYLKWYDSTRLRKKEHTEVVCITLGDENEKFSFSKIVD